MKIKVNGIRLYNELKDLLSAYCYFHTCPICGRKGYGNDGNIESSEQQKELTKMARMILRLIKRESNLQKGR